MSKSYSLSSLPDWLKLILLFGLVEFRHEVCKSEFKKTDYNIYITINKGEQIKNSMQNEKKNYRQYD